MTKFFSNYFTETSSKLALLLRCRPIRYRQHLAGCSNNPSYKIRLNSFVNIVVSPVHLHKITNKKRFFYHLHKRYIRCTT